MRSIVLAAALFAHVGLASAWGPEGHGLTGAIAELHLTAAAKAEVERLLKLENHSRLDEVSSWADAVRGARPDTAPGHYVDIPLKLNAYNEKRDCHYDENNNRVKELTCVVVMLPQWVAVLADKSRPDAERLEALKWVVHFAGDIHQPLHAEDNKDRGGNDVHVTYFGSSTKLHAIWDGGVIEKNYGWKLGPNFSFDHDAVRAKAAELDGLIAASALKTWMSQGSATNLKQQAKEWANWSHHLSKTAYKKLPAKPRPRGWESAYQTYAWPVIQVQLSAAGIRLAGILNNALK